MTDDELLAIYRDGRFRDLIDALRGIAAAAWAEGRDSIGADFLRRTRGDGMREATPNPYVSPEGTA